MKGSKCHGCGCHEHRRKKQVDAEGACFRCKKTGHLSKDCPTKNKMIGTTQEVQKKMTPKEMYKHI